MQNLQRRGFSLGDIPTSSTPYNQGGGWFDGTPIKLAGICKASINAHLIDIANTESLVLSIIEGESTEQTLSEPPFAQRLAHRFESLGAAFNEGDDQEIETLFFDAVDGDKLIAEDLWLKISWLSFYEEDASIRFRFSFGVDLEEDVAADPIRQTAAAELAEAIFPESAIITKNPELTDFLKTSLNIEEPTFVERILYFNAPNGGAYLHHDLERGHAGVAYAQISGSTLWLALPHQQLVNEIVSFVTEHSLPSSLTKDQQAEINTLSQNPSRISDALNSFSHDGLIHLINETEEFVQFLISRGHYEILNPGDAILLPQKDRESCCWHSVFCLGEEMGQALSFAIK